MTKRRIFFALWPTEPQRQAIEATIGPYRERLAGKWMASDNWHVTLVFIGNFATDAIPALRAAVASIPCPDISLTFERIEHWRRSRIACLEARFVPDELTALVDRLETASAEFGYRPEERRYRPHMTLARKARFFDPISLAPPIELDWTAFELLESRPTPAGSEYRPFKQ